MPWPPSWALSSLSYYCIKGSRPAHCEVGWAGYLKAVLTEERISNKQLGTSQSLATTTWPDVKGDPPSQAPKWSQRSLIVLQSQGSLCSRTARLAASSLSNRWIFWTMMRLWKLSMIACHVWKCLLHTKWWPTHVTCYWPSALRHEWELERTGTVISWLHSFIADVLRSKFATREMLFIYRWLYCKWDSVVLA